MFRLAKRSLNFSIVIYIILYNTYFYIASIFLISNKEDIAPHISYFTWDTAVQALPHRISGHCCFSLILSNFPDSRPYPVQISHIHVIGSAHFSSFLIFPDISISQYFGSCLSSISTYFGQYFVQFYHALPRVTHKGQNE